MPGRRGDNHRHISIRGIGCGASLVGIAALALVAGYALETRSSALIQLIKGHSEVLYAVRTDRPLIALTIDDGPDAATTPRILEVLGRWDARATFFLIADRIPGNEGLIRRILADGHEIGNHMTRDEASIDLSAAVFEKELLRAHRVLSEFALPRWFRPGSGWYDESMLATLKKHHYRCALGTIYPLDTVISSTWLAQKIILSMARSGRIIIMHDGGRRGERTTQTLAAVLPKLRQQGYRIVTLSRLAQ
jgi:peptidoglycan/xylan/chitin deacetylase (PgdA/CDA1 family)